MTFRLGILIGLVCGILLAGIVCSKRASREPVDRFDMATFDERQRQFKQEHQIESRLGRYHD